LILLEEEDDLFVPFHLLLCSAISSVLESYEASDNSFTLHNRELLIWKNFSFNGSELWEEVKDALQPYEAQINQYIRLIMVIPGIKSFVKVIGCEENNRYMLCTQMSVKTFMKYNLDIFCHYDLDVDICGSICFLLTRCIKRIVLTTTKYYQTILQFFNFVMTRIWRKSYFRVL
jgi:hypothetical protein